MSGTVLVVDDDDGVRGLAGRILRRSGYTVVEAASGEDALAAAEAAAAEAAAGGEADGGVILLLTDIVLPGLNGAELADRLRADDPGLPVVFMSGYEESELEDRGVKGVGTAYVTKPFTAEVLALVVRGALGE